MEKIFFLKIFLNFLKKNKIKNKVMKVTTDKKLIEELLDKGVEKIYPSRDELKKKLESGERIRLYCGFDPTAPSLHIGNAICINKLSQFQALGHEVIFLIGSFTAAIGDPTDKAAARVKITRETIEENLKTYQKQAESYFNLSGDNPALVKYNSEWNDKLNFKDLIELSSHFTVQQMIQRDMFQKRLAEEKPVFLHEFLYPLTQAYDSVVMDVDLEIGGNDQMFNMMCGRDLMKSMGKKDKCVMTLKLLADENGKKMGKSEGNAVFLDGEAEDIYGAVMSWSDGYILPAFELATKFTLAEVAEIKKQLEAGENPRNLKMKLAFEITKLVHGEEASSRAQENFISTVQNKEIPDDIQLVKIKADKIGIVEALTETGLVPSKSDARRMIKQGAVKLDGEIVVDEKMEIDLASEKLIQKGKRGFIKIIKA